MTDLATIDHGVLARVDKIEGDLSFRRRLSLLGLRSGAKVTVLRKAPLGSPLQVKVGNTCLSIRKDEALRVNLKNLA